jgi:predicted component of type VI protein secretion system
MSLTARNIESDSVNSCHGSDESTWTITTSETQPLLADTEGQAHVRKRTPLPVQGLAALCAVRLVDPIVFTQIFPYVNEMIDNLHLTDDPSQLGFYSGLVVCLRFPFR